MSSTLLVVFLINCFLAPLIAFLAGGFADAIVSGKGFYGSYDKKKIVFYFSSSVVGLLIATLGYYLISNL